MSTLADRMQLVLGWRGFSARKWAELAGLSENAVNTYLKRARLKPNAHLNGRTVTALARAAQVDADWFSSGRGDPEPQSATTATSADAKALIASLGKASGLSDEVLEAFRAHERQGASALYWMAQLLALSQTAKPPKAAPRAKAR